jgi:alpha-L-fucosidase 2
MIHKSPLSFILLLFTAVSALAQTSSSLWYNQPARYFEESLVLGNGKMGASVFGGVKSDMIYLNDITLWTGEPVDPYMNPDAYTNLPAVRDALNKEDYRLAEQLNKKLQGKFSESYAPLGTLYLQFPGQEEPSAYRRVLDLNNAVSTVSYTAGGTKFTREYFVSSPDKVMVIKLHAKGKGKLSFNIKMESLLRNTLEVNNGILSVKGYAPVHAEPNYRGNLPNPIVFDENRGTRFTTLVKIIRKDGESVSTENSIGIKGGSEAVIIISEATSFNGFDKDPVRNGQSDESIAREQLDKACIKNYEAMKKAHILDYSKYFGRVDLNLGKTSAPDLPTDERLKRYAEGKEDKNLEVLYFNFGRYLLISSSRTPAVPANLQGLWNPYIRPPWSSNYTININAEENYWPAELTNLSEMHTPLLGFISNLSKTGAVTAKTFYGLSGWVACHNSDIWAMSNPVGDFGNGDPSWANWNIGGTWLVSHLWEHFAFTMDTAYLRKDAYPLMRGAAEFCLGWLVRDKEGKLITSPSTSPENKYITPDGFVGATMYGGTADLAMIRECFEETVRASEILGTDSEFRAKLNEALKDLSPYKVGKKGNLQEWYYDWEDPEPKHRHQSHLYGLFPGHQISPAETPTLADACRKTLEIKGDQTTGWSKGWRINLWARLGDGNHAYKMYRELLNYVEPDSVRTSYSGGGGTYPNLFDAHPPFQIDGNFGGTAAVAEMLMQSSIGEIRLLPALPDQWTEGSFNGLCARGGFVVSMKWKDKKPVKVEIFSREGGSTRIVFGDSVKDLRLGKGERIGLKW